MVTWCEDYAETMERSHMDQPLPLLTWAVLLPSPTYSLYCLLSHISILFKQIHVISFTSDKHLRLGDISRGIGGEYNSRGGKSLSTLIPTNHGSSFCSLIIVWWFLESWQSSSWNNCDIWLIFSVFMTSLHVRYCQKRALDMEYAIEALWPYTCNSA